MNKLQEWHRKMELKHKREMYADELCKMLGISLSYYNKLNTGKRPIKKELLKTMKIVIDTCAI